MKLPRFSAINYAMHVTAFAELAFLGICYPLLLEVPGQPEPPDPIFFPDSISTAAPIWIRISAVLIVGLAFLIPALWVLTIHLASSKKGGRAIGWCVLGFASLVGLEGLFVVVDDYSPWEQLIGYSATFGIASAVGGYLILYSRWIYRLGVDAPIPGLKTSTEPARFSLRVSPETRQLLSRLGLFVIIVVIALMTTIALSYFPKFKESPQYITIGFFGIVGCGMVVTGLIREDTLAALIPWSKGK